MKWLIFYLFRSFYSVFVWKDKLINLLFISSSVKTIKSDNTPEWILPECFSFCVTMNSLFPWLFKWKLKVFLAVIFLIDGSFKRFLWFLQNNFFSFYTKFTGTSEFKLFDPTTSSTQRPTVLVEWQQREQAVPYLFLEGQRADSVARRPGFRQGLPSLHKTPCNRQCYLGETRQTNVRETVDVHGDQASARKRTHGTKSRNKHTNNIFRISLELWKLEEEEETVAEQTESTGRSSERVGGKKEKGAGKVLQKCSWVPNQWRTSGSHKATYGRGPSSRKRCFLDRFLNFIAC